ncbi:GtrA family protein [Enterococcus mundtii]|uniref:GtrA family protein n=1 Tax=Enterococcus mundtii TaxID=53346 RepID=UPI00129CF4D5|nr:GtrA family protein [Enterococcus mundtii]MRI75161.1 GtrA family protein [Enterococcus mundtii]
MNGNYRIKIKKNSKEIKKYIFYGIIKTVVNIIIFNLLLAFFNYQLSNFISWFLTVFLSYCLNLFFVFSNKNQFSFLTLFSFYLSRVGTYFIEFFILYIGISVFNYNILYVKLLTTLIVAICDYILMKKIIFSSDS